ncbi:hypothetical protein C8F01DRAFT_498210 [Mycena amicta]|nr:hypothetical protein C8F01DRAFT_498210 [Mycena amicta]
MVAFLREVVRRLFHNQLPLGVVRLFLLVLAEVLAIVTGGLCLKIWTKHHKSQVLLNEHLPPGISATLEYNDARTTSIVLFVTTHLVTIVVAKTTLIMLHDIFGILPKFILRRLPAPNEPLSSYTLLPQAAALLFAVVCLALAASFHMNVVFNRSGMVVVHQGSMELPSSSVTDIMKELGISLPYRDVQYIRVSAELAAPTIFFGMAALVATVVACCYRRKESAEAGSESSIEEK